jgi:hypothetical protein
MLSRYQKIRGWFSIRKTVCWEKIKGWFRKVLRGQKVVEARSSLGKIVREKRALSLIDLPSLTCEHDYVVEKQVWIRVATKKFELQNSLLCKKCKGKTIHPIR